MHAGNNSEGHLSAARCTGGGRRGWTWAVANRCQVYPLTDQPGDDSGGIPRSPVLYVFSPKSVRLGKRSSPRFLEQVRNQRHARGLAVQARLEGGGGVPGAGGEAPGDVPDSGRLRSRDLKITPSSEWTLSLAIVRSFRRRRFGHFCASRGNTRVLL